MGLIEVGRVHTTAIYPFKGMQGIQRDEISVRSVSVVGDRRKALVAVKENPLKRVDSIMYPGLLKYRPVLADPSDPAKSDIQVVTPNGGGVYSADDKGLSDFASMWMRRDLRVLDLGRGLYHSMPVSILGMESIAEIEERIDSPINPARFRENILVTTHRPYLEDSWVGRIIKFGNRKDSAHLAVVKPDARCKTVDLDPVTGEDNLNVLREIVRHRNNELGVYASVAKEGTIKPGDVIYLTF